MMYICLYLHLHQPFRVRNYRVFDIGKHSNYFLDYENDFNGNESVFKKVAEKSYYPTLNLLLEIIKNDPNFTVSLSISGTFIDQAQKYEPDLIELIKKIVNTGKVELVADTYYHSLAFFYSRKEFENQVNKHINKLFKLFGSKPKIFRNTELAYNNDLGKWADEFGFKAIFAEGWDKYLGWKSPNFLYKPPNTNKIKLFLKNYKLSDDIAFRFSDKNWKSWPLSANTYLEWLKNHLGSAEVINLFMDFETFGEHQWKDTGIFDFLATLTDYIKNENDIEFGNPVQLSNKLLVKDEIDMPDVVTWADQERDLSAWLGNEMQQDAIAKIYGIEDKVLAVNNLEITEDWRRLQTSDHFYYMCTKWWSDGDVHAYFSPYSSPYEAYGSFMNAYHDLELRIHGKKT